MLDEDYEVKLRDLIFDKISEAINNTDPDISEQLLEGYISGLNQALLLIDDAKIERWGTDV